MGSPTGKEICGPGILASSLLVAITGVRVYTSKAGIEEEPLGPERTCKSFAGIKGSWRCGEEVQKLMNRIFIVCEQLSARASCVVVVMIQVGSLVAVPSCTFCR